MLPLRRERRPGYNYQQQSPSYHVENLKRYLNVVSSLVPRDPSLSRFCIRHPDLQQSNIIVSKSPDSDCKVVGLIDWQYASILPMFLLAGIPHSLQYYADSVSQSMKPPSLPEDLDEDERDQLEYVYRRRLVHYHYVTSTAECNQRHYAAFADPLHALRGRLFEQAGAPWGGETVELKNALIEATERWEELTGGGVPCPVEIDAQDLRETKALNEELSAADKGFEISQSMCGLGEDGWVLAEDYENAVADLKQIKEEVLADAESEEERGEIMAHWPWDDMDETNHM